MWSGVSKNALPAWVRPMFNVPQHSTAASHAPRPVRRAEGPVMVQAQDALRGPAREVRVPPQVRRSPAADHPKVVGSSGRRSGGGGAAPNAVPSKVIARLSDRAPSMPPKVGTPTVKVLPRRVEIAKASTVAVRRPEVGFQGTMLDAAYRNSPAGCAKRLEIDAEIAAMRNPAPQPTIEPVVDGVDSDSGSESEEEDEENGEVQEDPPQQGLVARGREQLHAIRESWNEKVHAFRGWWSAEGEVDDNAAQPEIDGLECRCKLGAEMGLFKVLLLVALLQSVMAVSALVTLVVAGLQPQTAFYGALLIICLFAQRCFDFARSPTFHPHTVTRKCLRCAIMDASIAHSVHFDMLAFAYRTMFLSSRDVLRFKELKMRLESWCRTNREDWTDFRTTVNIVATMGAIGDLLENELLWVSELETGLTELTRAHMFATKGVFSDTSLLPTR